MKVSLEVIGSYPGLSGSLETVRNWQSPLVEKLDAERRSFHAYQADDTTFQVTADVAAVYHDQGSPLPVVRLEVNRYQTITSPDKSQKYVSPLKYVEMWVRYDSDGSPVGLDERGVRVWDHGSDGQVYFAIYKQDEGPTYEDFVHLDSVQVLDGHGNKKVYTAEEARNIRLPETMPGKANWLWTLSRYLTGYDDIYQRKIDGDDIMRQPLI